MHEEQHATTPLYIESGLYVKFSEQNAGVLKRVVIGQVGTQLGVYGKMFY